ncbi:MAG: hypothetical protein JRE23_02725 [Deltaproteobacteria bacterium]|nr:hypothetical protein [Deltaproteobacteria bacterium]
MTVEMLESQGTKLEMDTGSGIAKTITAMTLSNPTVLTSVAHGLSNGDVVVAASFDGADAADINGKSFVVQFVTDDTFAIDLDSTDLTIDDNTDTATMTPQSYTEICSITDWDIAGDTHNMIDYTALGSTRAEEKPGIPRGSALTFSVNWTSDDTGLLAAETARAARTLKTFKLTYSDDAVHTFTGYVIGINDSGGGDDKVNGTITIHRVGALTLS